MSDSNGHDNGRPALNAVSRVRENQGQVRVRKNLYNLTDQEVDDLRKAYEGLYAISDGSLQDERGYQWIAGVHGYPSLTSIPDSERQIPVEALMGLRWHTESIRIGERSLWERTGSAPARRGGSEAR